MARSAKPRSSPSQLRTQLIAAARHMQTSGLTPGKSGNLSVRCGDALLITPTGVAYDQLTAADLILLDLDGKQLDGDLLPSSEWHFHCALLKARPDLQAIVHTHSLHCTALACTGRDIPAFHYMVAEAGGSDIRCAPYATYGTEQLAAHAVDAMRGRRACLLANHGAIAAGNSPAEALQLAMAVENLAAQYTLALQLGKVQLLSDAQMAEVLAKFSRYGQQAHDEQSQDEQ